MMLAHNTLGDPERIAALMRGPTVKRGGVTANPELTPVEIELQRATLARDYDAMFTKDGIAYQWPRKVPLGKYSFIDSNGQRRYVPFTGADIQRFGYSPYARIKPKYKCPDKRRRQIIRRKTKNSEKAARKFDAADPRHIFAIYPGRLFCKPEKENVLKKVAVAAAVVTGAVFLGPAIVAKAGAVAGKVGAGAAAIGKGAITAGGALLGTAAKAAPMAVEVINGKRVIDAYQSGELPGPPIAIGDGSLTDYAQIVGQQMLEREQARAASDAEIERLRYLIEQERLALARGEQPHPPVVNSGLDPAMTDAQRDRADAATSSNTLLKFLAIGVPVGLLLLKRA